MIDDGPLQYNRGVTVLKPPFRLDYDEVRPGELTEGLAVPWQADFYNCKDPW